MRTDKYKAEIVKVLAENGLSSNKVSVKRINTLLCYAYYLTIRDESVNYRLLASISDNLTARGRAAATADNILGRTEISFSIVISDQVKAKWSEKYLSKVQKAIDTICQDTDSSYEGSGCLIDERFNLHRHIDTNGFRIFDLSLKVPVPGAICNSAANLSRTIFIHLQQ